MFGYSNRKAQRGMAKSKAQGKGQTTKLSVTFGTQGRKKKGYRMGIELSRSLVDIATLDELVTGAQLDCTLAYDPNAARDAKGQALMECAGGPTEPLGAICNVGSLSSTPDIFRFSLGFPIDVDVAQLDQFSLKCGTLAVRRLGDAKEPDDE